VNLSWHRLREEHFSRRSPHVDPDSQAAERNGEHGEQDRVYRMKARPVRCAHPPGTWPRPLLAAVRVSNKYLLNPRMRTLAGRKNGYAPAIRHTGRKSGKQYSTPVGAERVQDGFIIPLAYGTQVDWLQNVIAAGRATVSAKGETYDVTEPEVIDAATALPRLSPRRRRTFERLGIAQYLEVKLA
jgi:deazaflavin-dependent oxidoreductase (nitroreductase family)